MSDFVYKPTTALFKIKKLLKNNNREFIIQGGQGAGKTISILMLIIDASYSCKKLKISIVSDELSKMKRTVIRDFLSILKDWNLYELGIWNKTGNIFTFNNSNSFIEFLGLDMHDVGKGMRRDIVYFNEGNKLKLEAYRQVASRSKKNIIDYNPDTFFWGHELITPNNFIQLTFQDNEFLPKEEIQSILEYKNKGYNQDGTIKNEYWANIWRVYGLGEVGSVEGRVFTHFKKISFYDFTKLNLNSFYAIDWGKNHAFGIVELKYDRYNNNIYCHELNYDSENKIISKLTDNQKQLINSGQNGGVVIYTISKIGIPKNSYLICDSALPDNIKLLRSYGWEYAIGIDKPSGSVMAGITLLQSTNVYYTDCSKNIENEFLQYSYKKDRAGVIDDEVNKEFDDLLDPIRYGRRWIEKNKI